MKKRMIDGHLENHARFEDLDTSREGRLHISSPNGNSVYRLVLQTSTRVVRNKSGTFVIFTKTGRINKAAYNSLRRWGESVSVHTVTEEQFNDVDWCKKKANAEVSFLIG